MEQMDLFSKKEFAVFKNKTGSDSCYGRMEYLERTYPKITCVCGVELWARPRTYDVWEFHSLLEARKFYYDVLNGKSREGDDRPL